jgi:Fe-S cluster assembly iron-binding protein IscA
MRAAVTTGMKAVALTTGKSGMEAVMVNVTDRAKIALKSALSRSVEEPGIGLRVEVSEEDACVLFPDREKAGDQVIEHEGDVLLLLGEEVSQPLDGATIDLEETPEGTHLVVTKPDVPVDGTGRL